MPSIGIVIPAYNAEKYISETLSSISKQTFQNFECIIVNDGSTDRTLDIAKSHSLVDSRFRVITQNNQGPCVARNTGLMKLSPNIKYVTFMDADDIYRSHALKTLFSAIENNPKYIGVYGLAEFIIEPGTQFHKRSFADECRIRIDCASGFPKRLSIHQPTSFSSIITTSTMFPPGRVLARKETYLTLGGFDESMKYAEDWDLLTRMSRYGDFYFINDVILEYRRHSSNLGMSPKVSRACKKLQVRTFYSQKNSPKHKELVRKGWRVTQILDAQNRVKRIKRSFHNNLRLVRMTYQEFQ